MGRKFFGFDFFSFRNLFASWHSVETMRLAWPLIVTQVGHIVTGMVDNVFLGRIGASELGAGILSNNVFVLVLIFGMGMSFGSTPLVAGAHEQNDATKKASLFKGTLLINCSLALLFYLLLFNASDLLEYMRQPQKVTELARPYFDVLLYSVLPLALFFTGKQFCEGLGNTRAALIISVSGNLLNILLNYLLIYGKLGFPELGYMGAAWASFWARLFMGLSFMALIFSFDLTKDVRRVFRAAALKFSEIKELWKIGINSAFQLTFEVATFVVAGLMAGTFGEVQLDAHGIALSIAGFTYMFASGIGGAATIRTGAANARGNPREIRAASGAALRLVLVVMFVFVLLLIAGRTVFPGVFTTNEAIIKLASQLLIIAALFQLFDGLQVTAIGILRGLGDVRISTLVTFTGYWLLALPLAWFLAYQLEWETIGIWVALLTALFFVASGLLLRLRYLLRTSATKS